MTAFVEFLNDLMKESNLRPSQLAKKVGVSAPTMMRWLSGDFLPNIQSSQRLAEFSGESLDNIFRIKFKKKQVEDDGSATLPEIREYLRIKYPNGLDEDIVSMIELIVRKKAKTKE